MILQFLGVGSSPRGRSRSSTRAVLFDRTVSSAFLSRVCSFLKSVRELPVEDDNSTPTEPLQCVIEQLQAMLHDLRNKMVSFVFLLFSWTSHKGCLLICL